MRRPGSTAETLPVLEPQTAAQKPKCKGVCSPLAPGLLPAFPLKGTQGPQANKTKIKNAFSGVPATAVVVPGVVRGLVCGECAGCT